MFEERGFLKSKSHSVVCNPGAHKQIIARAIIEAHYPDVEAVIQNGEYPEGRNPFNVAVAFLCPQEITASMPQVLFLVDPVERFRAALWGVDAPKVDAIIDALEEGEVHVVRGKFADMQSDVRFVPQTSLPTKDFTAYAELRGGEESLFSVLGIGDECFHDIPDYPADRPELTAEQAARVKAFYQADIEMLAEIEAGGPKTVKKMTIPVAGS